MDLADILHYLGVIRDVAGVIETDDPGLSQALSGIMVSAQGQINAATASGSVQPSESNIGNAVNAVTAAAPSVLGILEKM